MPEGRMLKRVISESKSLGNLSSDSARLLYTWLIPWLDVEGRHSADPEIIKGHIFPKIKSMTISRIEKLLEDLAAERLIILYGGNGEKYLQLTKFAIHQKLDKTREAKSNIPAPTAEDMAYSRELVGNSRELALSKDKLSKDKLSIKADESAIFEDIWSGYPGHRPKKERGGKKPWCLTKFKALYKAGKFDHFKKATMGYLNVLKHKEFIEDFSQKAMYFSTWLNNWEGDYNQYVDKNGEPFKYEPKL